MANLTSATLRLWIYTGTYGTNEPASPTYVLYKEKSSSSDIITFEIAELVKDYIDIEYSGNYFDIQQTAWVRWEVVRTYDDSTTDNDLVGEGIAFTGYGYFQDAINPELSQDLLQTNTKIYHNCSEQLNIPILTGKNGVFKVDYFNGNTLVSSNTFGNTLTALRVDTTEYTADSTLLTSDLAFLKNATSSPVTTPSSPTEPFNKVIITTTNGNTITLDVYCIEDAKYTPYKIAFVNKFGVIQDLWFFKKRTDNVSISKEQYKENTLETTTTVSYSLNKATEIPYNFKTQKSLVLNTGFVHEQFNEVIQELLLTEHAWVHENGQVTPVLPKTSSLEYKTQLNDKLINFTIDFDYAFNEVNLIR